MGEWLICGEKGQPPEIRDFFKALAKSLKGKFPEEILSLITPKNISRLCQGQPLKIPKAPDLEKAYHFLTEVVPSAFGVDRLDYFRRDAMFTGVETGGIDIWEIIHGLRLHTGKDGKTRLLLSANCSSALEAVLQTRNMIYRKLYHNPRHRSVQQMIIRGLDELEKNKVSPNSMARLTDSELLELFKGQGGPFGAEIASRIENRCLYETIPLLKIGALPKRTRERLAEFREKRWTQFKLDEEKLAKKSPLPISGIFFDIEEIPAIKPKDFSNKLLLDEDSLKEHSLFELEPHLEILYGIASDYRTKRLKYRDYIENVSEIFFSFPYEYWLDLKSAEKDYHGKDQRHFAEHLYKKYFEPVISGFFCNTLKIKKEERDCWEKPTKNRLENYIFSILQPNSIQ